MQDLGTLLVPYATRASGAANINNLGQVVGQSGGHAFLYSGGVMQDLNNLVQNLPPDGFFFNDAKFINGQGQIIANGTDAHTYLLTPISTMSAIDGLLLD